MIYAITFRIDHVGDYDARYDSFVKAITAQAEGIGGWWAEPTSFYLLRSSNTAVELADTIVAASKFDALRDLLVVIHISGVKGHAVRGAYADKDVLTLLAERSK